MGDKKDLIIRNSTAEFLIFESQANADSIEVRYENDNLWLTQKMMAALFDVNVPAVSKHLQNIFAEGELDQATTVSKMETVQKEGERLVTRMIEYYNLDAVISVGYRINSIRATQFRRWATQFLKQFAITGYVLDRKRMENGALDYLNVDSTKRSRISTQQVSTTTKTPLSPSSSLLLFRTKCIMR